MTKKEKILKGLEACVDEENDCPICPYDPEYVFNGECVAALIKDLRQLLNDYDYALNLMVLQYCTTTNWTTKEEVLYNQFMSAGETAFKLLGIENGQTTEKMWKEVEK